MKRYIIFFQDRPQRQHIQGGERKREKERKNIWYLNSDFATEPAPLLTGCRTFLSTTYPHILVFNEKKAYFPTSRLLTIGY